MTFFDFFEIYIMFGYFILLVIIISKKNNMNKEKSIFMLLIGMLVFLLTYPIQIMRS